MRQFDIDAEARREIENALAVSSQNSHRIAMEFRMGIDHAIDTVTRNPEIGMAKGTKRLREYIMQRFPYSLIYVFDNDRVLLLAFKHHKQRSSYWKNRLPRN